jgi:predicted small secreted protein
MRRRLFVLILLLSTTVAACASNGTSSGGGGSNDVKVLNGCRVDPARICNTIRNQPVDMSGTGLQGDSKMVEQNSARTANITVPIKKPNGDEIFEIECGMNTLNQSVSWAQVKTGPPVTDDDAKFLRGAGYCSEPSNS